MVEIIPAILTNSPDELRELIEKCEGVALPDGRRVNKVSIDIIDGLFANNKTIDPIALQDIDTNLKIDFQLMVKEPINWVEKCVSSGADRIIGHVEMMGSQKEFVEKVQEVGLQVGLALDLKTKIEDIDPAILMDLDVVLLMSVPAGFGGQEFDKSVLKKIEKLDELRARDKTPFRIQDDGGITLEYIDDVRVAGVDEVSIGRRLFKGDLKKNIEKFLKAAYKV